MKEVEREIRRCINGSNLYYSRHNGCNNRDSGDEGLGCMEVTVLERHVDNICLTGMGRWQGPYPWFRCLVERFEIDGEYHDREGHEGIYVRVIAKKGVIIEDKIYNIISREAFAEFGYDSMLSDIALAAERYADNPEEFKPYLEKFADIAGVSISKIFVDLGLNVPLDI